MVGTVRPTCSHAPKIRGKGNHRQKKECPRHLKPQNPAYPAEWAKKAPHAARDISRSLVGRLVGIPHRSLHLRAGRADGSDARLGLGGLRRRIAHQPLARHFAGNAQSRAQYPPNG